MQNWLVRWEVNIEAEDATEAARKAKDIMEGSNDPDYCGNVFDVFPCDENWVTRNPEDPFLVDLDAE